MDLHVCQNHENFPLFTNIYEFWLSFLQRYLPKQRYPHYRIESPPFPIWNNWSWRDEPDSSHLLCSSSWTWTSTDPYPWYWRFWLERTSCKTKWYKIYIHVDNQTIKHHTFIDWGWGQYYTSIDWIRWQHAFFQTRELNCILRSL